MAQEGSAKNDEYTGSVIKKSPNHIRIVRNKKLKVASSKFPVNSCLQYKGFPFSLEVKSTRDCLYVIIIVKGCSTISLPAVRCENSCTSAKLECVSFSEIAML